MEKTIELVDGGRFARSAKAASTLRAPERQAHPAAPEHKAVVSVFGFPVEINPNMPEGVIAFRDHADARRFLAILVGLP